MPAPQGSKDPSKDQPKKESDRFASTNSFLQSFLGDVLAAGRSENDISARLQLKLEKSISGQEPASNIPLPVLKVLARNLCNTQVREFVRKLFLASSPTELHDDGVRRGETFTSTLATKFHRSYVAEHCKSAGRRLRTAFDNQSALQLDRALAATEESIRELLENIALQDSSQKPLEPNLEKLRTAPWQLSNCKICLKGGGEYFSAPEFEELFLAIERAEKWRDFFDSSQPHDKQAHRENIAKFGAKAAGLIALKKACDQLGPVFRDLGNFVCVPEFRIVDVATFSRHRAGQEIDSELAAVFEELKGQALMVRSSAVLSEDGEHLGAGIYRSFKLATDACFEDFRQAVLAVYSSVDSPQAIEYRRSCGISAPESMGVIVQVAIEDGQHGYINTVHSNAPSVLDVVFQERYIPRFELGFEDEIRDGDCAPYVFSREELVQSLVFPSLNPGRAQYLPADHSRRTGNMAIAPDLAQLSLLFEYYFYSPLQIEFVDFDGSLNIVQARPLPTSWTTPSTIKFPERADEVWRAQSLGAMDRELEILCAEDNSNSDGVVIFGTSFRSSQRDRVIEQRLPKSGAVMLMRVSDEMRGHIESRCLERGLTIITANFLGTHSREHYMSRLSALYGSEIRDTVFWVEPIPLQPAGNLRRLRVVSNGIEARVYPAE